MGKRELFLLVGFAAAVAIVYQFTAPPAGPNERRFSLGRLIESARREIGGNRFSAELTTTTKHAANHGLVELRLAGSFVEMQIVGEERNDVEATLRVTSTGYDEPEAKKLASETVLKADRATSSIGFRIIYPEGGHQRAWVTIKVPSRLRIRLDTTAGKMGVTNVAAAEIGSARGETTIKRIAGRLTVTHRAGRIVIEDAGSLKFTGRSSDALVTNIRGEASFTFEAGGELNASGLAGPIDADARSAELAFTKLEKTRGTIRVNATGGTVVLTGLADDARIDGRNTEIEVVMAAAAPVAVYNEGEDAIEITTPPGGFQLDAVATGGRVSLPDDLKGKITLDASEDSADQRASGSVRGGGPTLTLRANRGNIRIFTPDNGNPER